MGLGHNFDFLLQFCKTVPTTNLSILLTQPQLFLRCSSSQMLIYLYISRDKWAELGGYVIIPIFCTNSLKIICIYADFFARQN